MSGGEEPLTRRGFTKSAPSGNLRTVAPKVASVLRSPTGAATMGGVGQVNDALLKGQLQPAGRADGATQPRPTDQAQQPDSAQSIKDLLNRDQFEGGASGLRAQQAKFLQPELLQQPNATQQAQQVTLSVGEPGKRRGYSLRGADQLTDQ